VSGVTNAMQLRWLFGSEAHCVYSKGMEYTDWPWAVTLPFRNQTAIGIIGWLPVLERGQILILMHGMEWSGRPSL